jgi:Fe-S cluster biogenesis protein NfuA
MIVYVKMSPVGLISFGCSSISTTVQDMIRRLLPASVNLHPENMENAHLPGMVQTLSRHVPQFAKVVQVGAKSFR